MASSSKANSSKVLAAISVGGPSRSYEHHSRSIRKIDNGYVTREEHSGPEGDYKSSEKFSPNHPDQEKAEGQGNSMKAALVECSK